MSKGIKFSALLVLLVFLLSGCATYLPSGFIYTEVKAPAAVANGDLDYSKVGTAKATSILGIVATGDASIGTAAANGGIRRIKYIEYDVKNILGIIGEYTTTVYGD